MDYVFDMSVRACVEKWQSPPGLPPAGSGVTLTDRLLARFDCGHDQRAAVARNSAELHLIAGLEVRHDLRPFRTKTIVIGASEALCKYGADREVLSKLARRHRLTLS